MSVGSEIKLDFQREDRIGFPEAIYGAGKTPEHLAAILDQASLIAPRAAGSSGWRRSMPVTSAPSA